MSRISVLVYSHVMHELVNPFIILLKAVMDLFDKVELRWRYYICWKISYDSIIENLTLLSANCKTTITNSFYGFCYWNFY